MNNRQIKFRAWYKPDFNTKDGPLKFVQETDEDSNPVFRMEVDKDFEYGFNIPFSDKNWVVQQFTGTIDKNGREIFEGDIVKIIDHPTNIENHTAEVIFRKGSFCTSYSWTSLSNWGTVWTEVVGNIFENPELIQS
jgi:uncharacterized phage protein (TIGR01671 family)